MTTEPTRPDRRFKWRRVRWLTYFLILLGVAVWRFAPRPWKPTLIIETSHYVIASTASKSQTEQVAQVVEMLYNAYSNRFGKLPTFRHEMNIQN